MPPPIAYARWGHRQKTRYAYKVHILLRLDAIAGHFYQSVSSPGEFGPGRPVFSGRAACLMARRR